MRPVGMRGTLMVVQPDGLDGCPAGWHPAGWQARRQIGLAIQRMVLYWKWRNAIDPPSMDGAFMDAARPNP
ncbi:MAG TPA: hypothetical protein VFS24_03020 [Steroidobacteraceae bacterium]|nr:hypothetical protein [Steroidobacteraceae bacterium]